MSNKEKIARMEKDVRAMQKRIWAKKAKAQERGRDYHNNVVTYLEAFFQAEGSGLTEWITSWAYWYDPESYDRQKATPLAKYFLSEIYTSPSFAYGSFVQLVDDFLTDPEAAMPRIRSEWTEVRAKFYKNVPFDIYGAGIGRCRFDLSKIRQSSDSSLEARFLWFFSMYLLIMEKYEAFSANQIHEAHDLRVRWFITRDTGYENELDSIDFSELSAIETKILNTWRTMEPGWIYIRSADLLGLDVVSLPPSQENYQPLIEIEQAYYTAMFEKVPEGFIPPRS